MFPARFVTPDGCLYSTIGSMENRPSMVIFRALKRGMSPADDGSSDWVAAEIMDQCRAIAERNH